MSIASERAALSAALNAVSGLRAYDHIPPTITGTCAVVGLPRTYRPVDSSGSSLMVLPVTLYVPFGGPRSAEDAIEALIDMAVDAIHAGDAGWAVDEVRDFGTLNDTNDRPVALGCTLDVTIL